MQTLAPIDLATAPESTQALLASVERAIQRVPNMVRLMANAPSMLDIYLRFNAAFREAKMSPHLRGAIAVRVAELDRCDYHLSLVYALGARDGVTADALAAARRGESADPRIAAALRFVTQVVEARGAAAPSAVAELRGAGYGDDEIVEIIGMVVLAIFRDYFNLIAQTEADVPSPRLAKADGRE